MRAMGARVTIACGVGISSIAGLSRKSKSKTSSVRRLSVAGVGEECGMLWIGEV